jgi:hypothetical protein
VVAIGIRGCLVPMVTEMTMLAQRDRMEGEASWWVTMERSAPNRLFCDLFFTVASYGSIGIRKEMGTIEVAGGDTSVGAAGVWSPRWSALAMWML